MAPIPVEEQFQFLLSCIRYSNNGKIDFDKVAKDCDIVSKGAAAKRYERLMKANGINSPGGDLVPKTPEKPTTEGSHSQMSTPTKKASGGGKRKAATSKGSPKKAKLMKKVAVTCAEDLVAKHDEKSDDDDDDNDNDNGHKDGDDDDDGSLFKGVTAEVA